MVHLSCDRYVYWTYQFFLLLEVTDASTLRETAAVALSGVQQAEITFQASVDDGGPQNRRTEVNFNSLQICYFPGELYMGIREIVWNNQENQRGLEPILPPFGIT